MLMRVVLVAALAVTVSAVSQAEAQQSSRGYSVKKKRYVARRSVRPAPRFNRVERIGTPENEDFTPTPYVYTYGPYGNGPYQANQSLAERVTIGSPDYPVR